MPAQWTACLIGKMHLNGVTKKQLAEYMGITPEYMSMVLNGHREPDGAEERFTEALSSFLSERPNDTAYPVQ